MTLKAFVAALSCVSGAAWSAPVPVQTGEHDSFTRVVLRIPPGADWNVGRTESGYLIEVPGADGFSTLGFFDLIPRDRITGISRADRGDALVLETDCLCYAKAFLDRPDVLVVDIADGSPDPNSQFEVPINRKVFGESSTESDPYIPESPVLPLLPATELLPRPQEITVAKPIPHDVQPTAIERSLIDLQTSVAASVSTAVEQGLLDGGQAIGGSSVQTSLQQSEAPGVVLKTGIDSNAINHMPRKKYTQTGRQCAADEFFAIANWGNNTPFSEQLSSARQQITGEFDRFDQSAVTALARLYVHFGFGREAQQALLLDGSQSQERQFLMAIARIIDGDDLETSLFAEQVGCEADVALWAFLAQEVGPRDAVIQTNAILRGFGNLPSYLKDALSARLSRVFLDVGQQNAAMKVLDLYTNSDEKAADLASAEAAMLSGLGEEDVAARRFAQIVREDRHASPDTFVAMFDAAAQDRVALTSDDFELGDAMQFELADDPASTEIAIAQIGAYLSRGDFRQAYNLIKKISGGIREDQANELSERYASAAVDNMTDPAFLEFAFTPVSPGVSENTRQRIAARLDGLGFGPQNQHAETFIEASDVAVGASEEIGADRSRPNAARTDELGSLIHAEDIGAATEAIDGTSWQQGDWKTLAASDDPLMKSAADLAIGASLSELDPAKPLASGRELLTDSAETRQVLEDILNRFSSPIETP